MNIDKLFPDEGNLPPALPKEEMLKLLKLANDGSKEAKDKLIIHNIRLVLYEVARKFINVDYDKNYLVSLGKFGLMKAIDSFDISKGVQFSSYATKCIDNEILMFLRKMKREQNIVSFEEIIFENKDGNNLKLEEQISDDIDIVQEYEKGVVYEAVRKAVYQLPDREREIVMLYFGFYNDRVFSQHEISKLFNLTQPSISRILKKAVKKISDDLEKEEIVELHSKQEKSQVTKKENSSKKVLVKTNR